MLTNACKTKCSPEPTDPGEIFHHLRAHPDRLEGAFPVTLDDMHIGHRAAPYGKGESDDAGKYVVVQQLKIHVKAMTWASGIWVPSAENWLMYENKRPRHAGRWHESCLPSARITNRVNMNAFRQLSRMYLISAAFRSPVVENFPHSGTSVGPASRRGSAKRTLFEMTRADKVLEVYVHPYRLRVGLARVLWVCFCPRFNNDTTLPSKGFLRDKQPRHSAPENISPQTPSVTRR